MKNYKAMSKIEFITYCTNLLKQMGLKDEYLVYFENHYMEVFESDKIHYLKMELEPNIAINIEAKDIMNSLKSLLDTFSIDVNNQDYLFHDIAILISEMKKMRMDKLSPVFDWYIKSDSECWMEIVQFIDDNLVTPFFNARAKFLKAAPDILLKYSRPDTGTYYIYNTYFTLDIIVLGKAAPDVINIYSDTLAYRIGTYTANEEVAEDGSIITVTWSHAKGILKSEGSRNITYPIYIRKDVIDTLLKYCQSAKPESPHKAFFSLLQSLEVFDTWISYDYFRFATMSAYIDGNYVSTFAVEILDDRLIVIDFFNPNKTPCEKESLFEFFANYRSRALEELIEKSKE